MMTTSTASNDLLTAGELADRLGVQAGTILGWARAGRIPARRLTSKVVRFDLPVVLAALEAGATTRQEPAHDPQAQPVAVQSPTPPGPPHEPETVPVPAPAVATEAPVVALGRRRITL